MSFKLILEGKTYLKKDILESNSSKFKEEYMRDIISFLNEWWSTSKIIIAQTSGSTGIPKKIELEKSSMLVSAGATGKFFSLNNKSRICNPLPAKFIAGKMMLVRSVIWDCAIECVKPTSNPLAEIKSQVDFVVMTPHQLKCGLKYNIKRLQLIDTLLLGGSPISKELENQIVDIDSKIFLGYGMTETMSHVALRRVNGSLKTDVYEAVHGIRFEQDDRSCLVIHTDELLEERLITNDIIKLVNEKKFIWLGRFDNVVNSGGIKLYPRKIEEKIASFIKKNFYIKGENDPILGERIVLYLEDKTWSSAQTKNLMIKLQKCLDHVEIPKEVIVVDKFEYTENGKLIRKTN